MSKNKIQKVKFISEKNISPVLSLVLPKRYTTINYILSLFKPTTGNPNSSMIEFVLFLNKYSLASNLEISNTSHLSETDVLNVSLRKPDLVEFVYKKSNGETEWRKIDLIEEDSNYMKGNDVNDNNKFKCFKKCNIVGGRIIKQ